MARYENETQSMIENPPNLQCRNYPLATSSMVISLTDIPWYPPYTPDGSHYHNCLEIGLCLSGEGTVEMSGSSWRFSAGALLMVPKGVFMRSITRANRLRIGVISPWTATAC